MENPSDAFWAASSAWVAVAQLADAGKPTAAAALHAKNASNAASAGKVREAQEHATKATDIREKHMGL